MTSPLDPQQFDARQLDPAEARIDALARQAGGDLRRPAPTDGITRAKRAKHTKQMTRLGGAGIAAVAILAIGAFALNGGDADQTIVPATVSTFESDLTVPDSIPDPTESAPPVTEAPDETIAPTSTVPPGTSPVTSPTNAAGDPDVVYVGTDFSSLFGSEVSTVDPTTGAIIDTFVVDEAASDAARAAQDALVGLSTAPRSAIDSRPEIGVLDYEVPVGDLVYRHTVLPSEIPVLTDQDPDALPLFDRCQQAELSVEGAIGSALPARARSIVASPDGTRLAAVVSDCPVAGTLADGEPATGFDTSVLVFDASRPDLAGRAVVDGLDPFSLGSITFSEDGRFMAVEVFGAVGPRLFDLEARIELDLASGLGIDDGCTAAGTKWSRFIGPWVGGSSVAVTVSCDDGHRLVIRDLAKPDALLAVTLPAAAGAASFAVSADVDRAHFDRPETAWFTICDAGAVTCWVGRGNNPLVELPGVVQASFLPLGFEYGG